MNLPLFISKRISKPGLQSFSSLIHKIAIVSISVGLGIMIISYIIMGGFEDTITNKMVGFVGHLQVTKYTLNSTYEELPISKEDSIYQFIKDLSYVKHIQGVAHKVGLIQTDDEIHGIVFKGVDEDFNLDQFGQVITEGRVINNKTGQPSYEIMISKKIADLLKISLQDEIRIYFIQNPIRVRKFKIAGIYTSGMEEFDEQLVIGDIRIIQQLNDWRNSLVGTLEVFINDFDKLDAAEEELFRRTQYDLFVDKITDKHIEIFDWLSLVNRNVTILLTLILFIASFNMVSVLLILIMERTQMIGVLKAIGANNKFIRQIFTYHGIRLIVLGLVWGNIIGLSFGFIQDKFKLIPLDPVNFYMEYVPIKWGWTGIIGLNILTFTVVTLVLVIPTLLISKIEPIKSIKFD